jgi:rhamnosyltransferase
MSGKKISVIIPVKNGAHTLEKCLASLRNQTIGKQLEIIILDSVSTDGSREIALEYGTQIINIPDRTFNHGLTRNLGVQHASGEFIFFTVQDAWIWENDMLEKMVRHFEEYKIMGVVGHQAVPHEKDKNPLVWFKRYSEPVPLLRELKDIENFSKLNFEDQQSLIAWDDVVAMYRKDALVQLPFVATEYAEDWVWSRDALLRGWSLVYDPGIVVFHYHHSGYHYSYKVAYAINYHFYKFFNFKPVVSDLFVPLAKATYHLCKNSQLNFKEKIYWIWHNYSIRFGVFNSNINFLFHFYLGGVKAIQKRYNKVCKILPQGSQKS